jgi:tRNA 2-selenouridine synthase
MAITRVTIEEFLQLANMHAILDVRSPGEFSHAHIPNAIAFPLFTDEERKLVGTAYKQESKEKAIKLGLAYFGNKMVKMVEEAEALIASQLQQKSLTINSANGTDQHKTFLVHCWRGGMRSAGVAWLLDLYGYKVYTLIGGYKAYRKWVLQQFEKKYSFALIGGFTGSGKTEVLEVLSQQSKSVIDLEKLACHKGSAFGNLGQPKQPSQEMFENLLAEALFYKSNAKADTDFTNSQTTIWLEDESQRIGNINIPTVIFEQMRKSTLYFLEIPFEERLQYIYRYYGTFEKEKLLTTILRIKKRLGGLETKSAINFLLEDNTLASFAILLQYYDKYYLKSLENKRPSLNLILKIVSLSSVNATTNASLLLNLHSTGS